MSRPTRPSAPAVRRCGVLAAAVALAVTACTAAPGETTPSGAASGPSPTAPTAAPSGTPGADAAATAADWPSPPALPEATATPQDVVTGLVTPWGLAFLPGGAPLVTLRDPAQVAVLTADGARPLTGPGADELVESTQRGGEGGLLGVAVSPAIATDRLVYLYRTTADGNEVVRAELDPGAGTLGPLEPVLTGIPAAGNHNGGRIAFGPDGHLYVATGDAGDRPAAQDPDSLAGKILRLTADGDAAPGNPVEGSPVWSLGHRNVQGLAWDDAGTMYASEFGQDTLDELNVVEPGGNYGWPEVEGAADVDGFVDPIAQWHPDDASPSGIAWRDGTVHVAGLGGRRLLTVTPAAGGPARTGEALVGELGRLRHVAVGPDDALWLLTQNTDGRGSPRPGDDRVVRITAP